VPERVHAAADSRLVVPLGARMRSLNVAVTVAMALGEALRQTGGFPQPDIRADGDSTKDERAQNQQNSSGEKTRGG